MMDSGQNEQRHRPLQKDIRVLRAVEDLATCSYTFSELLSRVQAAVCPHTSVLSLIVLTGPRCQIDRLNLEGCANLDQWVSELDKRIEGILPQRLSHVIRIQLEFGSQSSTAQMRWQLLTAKSSHCQ
ncbi:hypothetical protein FA95DRAFT_1563115 [Auriscalpium vulgare]|uniref:Uncharacterized protein n=1 Tax=Auriscalpium vulgare TaxID=40419 RepID=A0ACB8RI69_9AGAM|nr:hypothetical protein FA95DRAFT_1563115 [Auriscalpium vulgare]